MAAAEILTGLVQANFAVGVAIVVVIALRKAARQTFGARLAYGLWAAPILVALVTMVPGREVFVVAPGATIPTPLSALAPPLAAAPFERAASLDLALVVLGLWLLGVIGSILVMVILQRRFLAEAQRGAIGPAVVGLVSPRIIIPSDFDSKFTAHERALVLAHEEAHIARQDSRLNGLSAAIQCLFWFNPLIHLAAHLARIDQELACDEAVVTRFPNARRTYAEALVKAQLAIRPLPLGCYWPSGTQHPLLERIAMLNLDTFSPPRRLVGASTLTLLCACAGFASWAAQPAQVRITQPNIAPASAEPTLSAPAIETPVVAKPAQLALLKPAPSPQAPAPKAQVLGGATMPANAWGGQSIDPSATATVTGTVVRVRWDDPASGILLKDLTTGNYVTVYTDSTDNLVGAGLTREVLRAGTTITVSGYGSTDRTAMFADPGLMRNAAGSPLIPATAQPNLPDAVSQRLATCDGYMPASVMATPTTEAAKIAAAQAWATACEAKLQVSPTR